MIEVATVQNVAQNVVDAVSLGSVYALLTLGLALMFGVMGLLNWAYGELMMVGGYTLVVVSGTSFVVAVPLMIVVVVICAVAMEIIAFPPRAEGGRRCNADHFLRRKLLASESGVIDLQRHAPGVLGSVRPT